MKKILLLLVLSYPFLLSAQHDDIYFVPTKNKQVTINIENSSVTIDNSGVYAYEDSEEVYSDDYYEFDDEEEEFRYSTRILRFRSPRLYWGLMYSGMNDWMLYDDGYYLDLYPAYSNSLYYWPVTSYNWCVWDSWYYQRHYWGYHPAYHWNGYHHHIHGGFRPPYIAHNSWRPVHKVHKGLPLNKDSRKPNVRDISPNKKSIRGEVSASTERGGRRVVGQQGVPVSNRVASANQSGRGNTAGRNNDGRSTAVSRQQPQRGMNNGVVNQRNSSSRLQQTSRTSNGAVVKKESVTKKADTRGRTNEVRRTKSSSSSNNSRDSYRSGSSSGEYNRPSSTSVSRQRSSSSSVRSSSYGGGSHQRGNSTSRGGTRR